MENLINETLESYKDYLEKLPKGCLGIAELIRTNQLPEALNGILNFSNGVTWLTEAAGLLNSNGVSIELEIEMIHDYLNEVNDALAIQDYTLVADLFEYEFAPFFEQQLVSEA